MYVSNVFLIPVQTQMLSCLKRSTHILSPYLQSALLILCYLEHTHFAIFWSKDEAASLDLLNYNLRKYQY